MSTHKRARQVNSAIYKHITVVNDSREFQIRVDVNKHVPVIATATCRLRRPLDPQ